MRSLFLYMGIVPATLALCPPPGPLLPPPIIKKNTFTLPKSAFDNFTFLDDTTFSVQARIGDTEIFEYSHAAPGYHDPKIPLRSTKLRIGSVTKLYTALALKLSYDKIGWNDPIGKFVPELSANKAYDDVTIASLVGHTSGLGRFGYVLDFALRKDFQPASMGIPSLDLTLPKCDMFPGADACSRAEVMNMFNAEQYSPTTVNTYPLYSNIAYVLLGYALEKAYGKSYEEVMQDLIFTPLNLKNTSFAVPTDKATTLLPKDGDVWFLPDYKHYNPTGGIWTTPDEMMTVLRAISNHSLLSAAQTRKWMQPTSVLPTVQQLVGAPWEIYRPTISTLQYPRPIDIYTKSGGVKGYTGWGILVPEYDITVTINVAGNSENEAVESLMLLIMEPLIEFADQQARQGAKEKYAGTYTLPGSNNTFTLTVDNGPGLAITNFTIGGMPILSGFAKLKNVPLAELSARLYPTDPDSLGTGKEIWTIGLDKITTSTLFADFACRTWMLGDPFRYMKERLDTVVFEIEGEKVKSVDLKAWKTVLNKRKPFKF